MKCSKAQRLINDYVDNLLDIKDIRSLKNHLEECADCRDLLNDFGSIVDNAGSLSPVRPSGDSWPEIKREVLNRNRAERKSFFNRFPVYSGGWSFALSTLLVVVILTPLIYYGFSHIGNSDSDHERAAVNHLEKAEQHYQAAIEALGKAIEGSNMELGPELASVFKENLEIIDNSIRVCKTAVEKHPDSTEARKFLLICYRKKVELLNEIKDLTMHAGQVKSGYSLSG